MGQNPVVFSKPFRICGFLIFLTVVLPALATAPIAISPNQAEQFLFEAANQDRAARGLHPLHRDPTLARAALYHARQMAEHQNISHQFPGEPELSERAAAAGARFSLITENVAEATDSKVIHDLWMHSEGHRDNLLDPEVNSVGIAVIERNHQFYAVEDFASTFEPLSIDQQESTVASLLAQSGLQIATDESTGGKTATIEDARRTCTMQTGYSGQRHPWYIMRYTADNLNELPAELHAKLISGRSHQAAVGACVAADSGPFTSYNIAVLLYP